MIVDHRVYRLHPGNLPRFLELYARMGLPLQRRHLGEPLGWYVSMEIGPLNEVIHLWGYKDLADRAARRAALQAEPGWAAYLEAAMPLLQTMENRIVTPAPFFTPPGA